MKPAAAANAATVATVHDTPAPRFAPGAIAAALLLCIYGSLALTVDFPRAALGIQSDEATYYMMGHSLAADGDLTYRREDLMRVWREFPSGPTGLFLKRGQDILESGLMLRPPFFWTRTQPDPDADRYFYGKSFIYPLIASPFVRLFGTNGFLVLHALLLALVTWCGYLFLHARMRATVAALLAGAFVMATVVPVYFVWITPELFNFALGMLGYFCWLYKEALTLSHARHVARWLSGPHSDRVAAILLGLATFSKVSNVLLFPPIVIWQLWHRRWGRAAWTAGIYALCVGGLFAANMAISGEWNYQGGQDRRTFVHEFPFQTPGSGFGVGAEKARNEALTDIILDKSVFWTNLLHNVRYYFVGRYSGLVAYFFPAVFALVAFLSAPRRRPAWQYLVLAAGVAQILLFIITLPYTWFGGGGSVGNRYFMGVYGIFLFLLPPISRVSLALIPWALGALFTAQLVLNPFASSFRPGDYAKHGPLRWLPVELTNVYDLPINTDTSKVRIWFGDNPGQNDPGFQIYFLDDNAYQREADKSFWVRGESRAEFLIKTDRPMKRLVLTLTAGPVATDATARLSGRMQRASLAPGGSQQITFTLPPGFPYQGRWPVWVASISSSAGFVPIFYEAGNDTRFLGVRVKPMLVE
ncbi:MAG: hypothetical protein LC753_02960 [Acidobacteria bacterium]|nr:hypothetical protein [Acidobacteriota bacterium]MCA1649261.1 hypothetical protein [Acidobacteriota bacterium]